MPRTLSLGLGNTIEVLGIGLGVGSLLLADRTEDPSFFTFLLLVVAWVSLWFFPHCLTHYLVGRMLGIHFLGYLIAPSAIVKLNLPGSGIARRFLVLGLRVDRHQLQRVSKGRRAAMHISGAVASMLLPITVPIYALLGEMGPISYLFALLSLGNILFTSYFSLKVGDLYRARGATSAV